MFRVPNNPDSPTFDDTFKVSFWRWLGTSFSSRGKAERHEWMRRRNAGAKVAETNQIRKADELGAEYRAARAARREQRHRDH